MEVNIITIRAWLSYGGLNHGVDRGGLSALILAEYNTLDYMDWPLAT